MGPSQSSQKPTNLISSFVNIEEFTPIINKDHHEGSIALYQHKESGKLAQLKNFDFGGTHSASVEQYYLSRAKLEKSPYIFELIQSKVLSNTSDQAWSKVKNSDSTSNTCTMVNLTHHKGSSQGKSLWLFVEASTLSLQDQIMNRRNKKPFEEIQLWSVLSSAVLGAIILLQNGFKQPVLSPRGIGLSPDGIIKVSEWEIVAKLKENSFIQEGELIFQRLGQPKLQNNNPLNELLLSYYWAPEGLKAIQKFISLGKKQPLFNTAFSHRFKQPDIKSNKFQIFSLGMTLISMCLRNFYYRTDTFSEKYLSKLAHQAIEIRKVEGKQLSKELKYIIESMVKWDASERISYLQLRDQIINYLSRHNEQMRNSEISIKTFEEADHLSHKATHKNKSRTSSFPSKLGTQSNSGNSSFMEANSFTLGDAEINLVPHSSSQQDQLHCAGSTFTYEGSGMVQQGTGDDDWNLQQEKEELIQDNDNQQIQSTPVTHRTEKSIKPQQNQIVCPVSTPNLAPSPATNKNPVKSPSISRSPYSQLNIRQSFESKPFSVKNNKVYLEEESAERPSLKKNKVSGQLKISIPSDCHMTENSLNSTSNRGSYRSSNKEPPFIKSARFENSMKTSQSTAALLNQCSGIFLNEKKLRNEVIIQYKNGLPQPIQTQGPDIEDIPDKGLSLNYFSFGDEILEIQSPDIFQTFLEHEQIPTQTQQSVPLSVSFSKIHLSPTQSLKRKSFDAQLSNYQKQPNKFSIPPKKDSEYMTFNKHQVFQESLENKFHDFVPSKWNKGRCKNDQKDLFTDPKLLEYIRSPIREGHSISQMTKSKQNNDSRMKFQHSGFIDKENIKDNYNKDSLFSSIEKSPIDSIKINQHIQDFFTENSHTSKIVKEQVSKGFYEGEKKNGLRSGYGIFYYSEGGKYRGNWLNNKMHGKGTLEYADGRVAYQGEWCNDELHGKGVLYNQSPNFVTTSLSYADLDELDECWIFYEGGFEHDDKSGIGLLVLSNHEQFIGEFKNDMAEGMGEYLRLDGTTVKGIWQKNKLIKTIEA